MQALHKKSGFTLIEVLAALFFMAIVIPVTIAALHIAGVSGEVAERKEVAARVASDVLNNAVVTWTGAPLQRNGTVSDKGRAFQWSLQCENCSDAVMNAMGLRTLTVVVLFPAGGRTYDFKMSTWVNGS